MKNFAVIGVGRMGSKHAVNLAKGRVKGARLACICDVDKAARERCAAKCKAPAYADYKQMAEAEKLDAVVIATPHYSHVEIAKYFLTRGVAVLTEKPVSVTVEWAEELNEVARKSGTLFGIMYNQRTNNVYAHVRELVKSGRLGAIRRANITVTDWYRSQFYYDMGGWRASWSGEGGGTLINQCVHQLDVMQWILGMPRSVTAVCRTVNRNITTENEVLANFAYKDFNAVFTASAHEVPGVNMMEIAGDRGLIKAGKFKADIYLLEKSEEEINALSRRDYGNKEDKKYKKYTVRYGLFRLIRDGLRGQQCNILCDFARVLNGGGKLLAPGEEGINGLQLINGVYASHWTGKQVALPLDGKAYTAMLKERAAGEKKGGC